MSQHMIEWIPAYYDGELRGAQRKQLEAHLAECAACQAELEALQGLSALLQANPPMPSRTPATRFAAQVRLRLPPAKQSASWQRALRLGWQAALLGVVGGWAFAQAVLIVAGIVLLILDSLPTFGWRIPLDLTAQMGGRYLHVLPASLLGPASILDGSLVGALDFGLTLLSAASLMSWLASWWAYRRHMQKTQ